jgi:hypothetical protein
VLVDRGELVEELAHAHGVAADLDPVLAAQCGGQLTEMQ